MKTIYLLILILLLSTSVLSAAKITSQQNNGLWNTNSTWNLNRRPAHNDTIIIAANITVKLKGTIELNNVVLHVYGTLLINEGDLKLNNASRIEVYQNGFIRGEAAGIIEIGGTKKFDYSNSSVFGPAYADRFTASEPNGFNYTVLPVTFISFEVKKFASNVELAWSTAGEYNNSHFDVLYSNDGRNWKTLTVVFAAANMASNNKYSYRYKTSVETIEYYKLKQVDKNGQTTYSPIKILYPESRNQSTKIYAASKEILTVEFINQQTGKVIIRVLTVNGQIIKEQQISNPSYRYQIHLPGMTTGTYLVQIKAENSQTEVKKIIL